jgi:light-harvesting protein B-800-850 alpha chain
MNQGRIWCVVHPTVGLPLFLGSVALMSFTVHFAVLNNTSWMKDFYNGVPMKHASVEMPVAPVAEIAPAKKFIPMIDVAKVTDFTANDAASVVVKIKPKAGNLVPKLSVPS